MIYCILTEGRTGSSWICDLLNSHSRVECHYEIFKDQKDLSKIEELKKREKNQVFKILHHQVSDDEIERLIHDQEVDLLFLKRRNPIERYVSLKLAEKTGVWHIDQLVTDENISKGISDIAKGKYSLREIWNRLIEAFKSHYNRMTYKPDQITIDIDDLKNNLNYEKALEDKLNCPVIIYDELYELPPKERHQKLLSYFKLPYQELKSQRQKIDYHSLSDRIENLEKIKSELKNTDYAHFLP